MEIREALADAPGAGALEEVSQETAVRVAANAVALAVAFEELGRGEEGAGLRCKQLCAQLQYLNRIQVEVRQREDA
jgi:hypothetical protein